MLTLQHSLITLISVDGDTEKFRDIISYILIPDAIRYYTGARQISHFEENSDKYDVSWMKFPVNLKKLDRQTQIESHLANNIKDCCIGETTIIPAFDKCNEHLPLVYYTGVKLHLTQDFIYDSFIRSYIDCSKKYDNIFIYGKKTLNGKEVKHLITEIEEDGIAILAKWVYEQYNIRANQQWFKENVYDVISRIYSKELADSTYKYMKIREDINDAITTQNWNNVRYNGAIDTGDYLRMYRDILRQTYDTLCDLNFRTYKIIGKVKKDNKTVAVDLLKCNGSVQRVNIDKLKKIMKNNIQNVFIQNAKLTSNNRLIIT